MWREIVSASLSSPWYRIKIIDDIGLERNIFDEDIENLANEDLRIVVETDVRVGAVHLYTIQGFEMQLGTDNFGISEIYVAELDEPFSSLSLDFSPWVGAPRDGRTRDVPSTVLPRRLARTLSSQFAAPPTVATWLVLESNAVSRPSPANPVYRLWRSYASRELAKCLASELYVQDGHEMIVLHGSPSRRMLFGSEDWSSGELFSVTQEAARWVFLDGASGASDAEVRHVFLSCELARATTDGRSFAIVAKSHLSAALESAQLLYRAHLRSGTKETLKALADLRKALADEVQKVMQQTRDLSAAIWRDIAVAIGAITVKVGLDASRTSHDAALFAYVLILVAGYICLSFWINTRVFRDFWVLAERSLNVWRGKLYAFLDDEDFRKLARDPLQDAKRAYEQTLERGRFVVLCLAVALLIKAAIDLGLIKYTSAS